MKRAWWGMVLASSLALGGWLLATWFMSSRTAQARAASASSCSSPIISSTTWTVISSPYLVCSFMGVPQGVTLTIQPGVEVQFQSSTGMNVNGTLLALGTADAPITLTGVVTSPGSWQGLGIYGTLTQPNQSSFSYVTFDYGGVNGSSGAQLYLDRADITITHSVFRNGGRNGVLGTTQGLANISTTSFQSNTGYAVYFGDGTVNPVLGPLTATGNGTNGVGLGGFAYLQGDHVWEYTGIPYIVAGGIQVQAGSTLLIEPGVEVDFAPGQVLQVYGNLTATGLPSQPITFTGTAKTPGSWGGLSILGSPQSPGVAQLDYATVEYGGTSQPGPTSISI